MTASAQSAALAQRARLASVLCGEPDGIEKLRALRRASLASLRRDPGQLDALADLRRWTSSALASAAGPQALFAADFETFRGATTSLLKRPAVLRRPLESSATACLLELVRAPEWKRIVASVFRRSDLASSCRYETFARDGRPVIRGEDGRQLRHLAAIAHELGHCLRDESQPGAGWSQRAESEAAAQYLEEIAAARAIEQITGPGSAELASWHAYQRQIDALNHHFAALEWHELGNAPQVAALFAEPFRFLRPSYPDRAGSELVYAAASVLRDSLLARADDRQSVDAALRLIGERRNWIP